MFIKRKKLIELEKFKNNITSCDSCGCLIQKDKSFELEAKMVTKIYMDFISIKEEEEKIREVYLCNRCYQEKYARKKDKKQKEVDDAIKKIEKKHKGKRPIKAKKSILYEC
jgi:hypothetical protein